MSQADHAQVGQSDSTRADEPLARSTPYEQMESDGSHNSDDQALLTKKELKRFSGQVNAILKPVCITMLIVIIIMRSLFLGEDAPQRSFGVYTENPNDSNTEKAEGAALNALMFLGMIVGATVLLIVLFYFRCMKVLYGYLFFSIAVVMGLLGAFVLELFLDKYGIEMDSLTFYFFIYNFTIVGIIAVFWEAPLLITQGYLVIISALLATSLSRLPEWTGWAVLGMVALYDVCAVLTPCGPLKKLLELAQERQQPIPGLLYSVDRDNTIVVDRNQQQQGAPSGQQQPQVDAENPTPPSPQRSNNSNNSSAAMRRGPSSTDPVGVAAVSQHHASYPDTAAHHRAAVEEEDDEDEGRGLKLGLGDFVFYSVLVAKAAVFDITTMFTCVIGILTGLCGTLILLFVFGKALPALPFSIAFGMLFYFVCRAVMLPYIEQSVLAVVTL